MGLLPARVPGGDHALDRARAAACLLCALAVLPGCAEARDPIERAEERSRRIVGAEWSYAKDTIPTDAGPEVVDRCRITYRSPDAAASDGPAGRTVDVACGVLFLGLEPGADSAWVERVADAVDGEIVDRAEIPAWATSLDEPVRYVLLRVERGREQRTLERALASEGIRFVDVREVARRRP